MLENNTSDNAGRTTAEAEKKNKRIGVCLECGYEWTARSPDLPKPPRCSKCGNKTTTAWKDELTSEQLERLSEKENQNPAAEPATAKKEKANNPVIVLGENGIETVSPEAAKAIAEATGGCLSNLQQNTAAETNRKPAAEEKPKEIYISEIDATAQLIEAPAEFTDEEETEECKPLSYVAWENQKGDIEYGAVVSAEAAKELTDKQDREEDEENKKHPATVKDIDVLKAAGILTENKPTVFNEDEEDSEEKSSIAGGFIMALCLLVVGFVTLRTYLKAKEKERAEQRRKRKTTKETTTQTQTAKPNANSKICGL